MKKQSHHDLERKSKSGRHTTLGLCLQTLVLQFSITPVLFFLAQAESWLLNEQIMIVFHSGVGYEQHPRISPLAGDMLAVSDQAFGNQVFKNKVRDKREVNIFGCVNGLNLDVPSLLKVILKTVTVFPWPIWPLCSAG